MESLISTTRSENRQRLPGWRCRDCGCRQRSVPPHTAAYPGRLRWDRIPMAKIRHGVVQMGQMAGAGGKRPAGRCHSRRKCVRGRRRSPRKFPGYIPWRRADWGDGNQTDSAVADFIASVEKFRSGSRRQSSRWAPFDRIEKGPSMLMPAMRAHFSTGCSGGNVFHAPYPRQLSLRRQNFCQRLLRQCHGGGTVGGNAVGIFVGEISFSPSISPSEKSRPTARWL